MKKVLIAAVALMMGASLSLAAIGISWDAGGWMSEYGGTVDGPAVLVDHSAFWQLIWSGDDVADTPDLSKENFLTGDDKLIADRTVPQGGGTATDSSSWDEWLQPAGGQEILTTWTEAGYVYQRVWQDTPSVENGGYYFESGLVELKTNYSATDPLSLTVSYYDADAAGVVVNNYIPGSGPGPEPPGPTPVVPEPATMSLLGLGALAMVLRRKLSK